MLQKVFSIKIESKSDMARVEEVLVGLLGGEHHRCSFLRSGEFIRLRNLALYPRHREQGAEGGCPLHSVHIEGLKITLTPTGTVCVYLTDPCVVPVPPPPTTATAMNQEDMDLTEESLAGKKRRCYHDVMASQQYSDSLAPVDDGGCFGSGLPLVSMTPPLSPEASCDEAWCGRHEPGRAAY
jgi:hypothetical protein